MSRATKTPFPKAWLSAASEAHVDSFVHERMPNSSDVFTRFASVLRRSNPLLPSIITGPLHTLSHRICAHWSSISPDSVEFHSIKMELLDSFCYRLSNLALFQHGRNLSTERLKIDGLEFYQRPEGRNPNDYPFIYTKREERLEAIEICYFLTLILSTAVNNPSVDEMPEGPIRFLPYYAPPEGHSAPDRMNAASLAWAAKHFRQDRRLKSRGSVFHFNISDEEWVKGVDNVGRAADGQMQPPVATTTSSSSQAATPILSGNDERGYRRLAQVSANSSSMHGAVSYCVLKLLAVVKELRNSGQSAPPERDDGLTATHAILYAPISLISPLYMFSRTPMTLRDHPGQGTIVFLYVYGCTPVCVNGAIDMGVYNFQRKLIDALIQKAFVRDNTCQTAQDAWRRFGWRIRAAISELLSTTPPVLPFVGTGEEETLPDDDSKTEYGNSANFHSASDAPQVQAPSNVPPPHHAPSPVPPAPCASSSAPFPYIAPPTPPVPPVFPPAIPPSHLSLSSPAVSQALFTSTPVLLPKVSIPDASVSMARLSLEPLLEPHHLEATFSPPSIPHLQRANGSPSPSHHSGAASPKASPGSSRRESSLSSLNTSDAEGSREASIPPLTSEPEGGLCDNSISDWVKAPPPPTLPDVEENPLEAEPVQHATSVSHRNRANIKGKGKAVEQLQLNPKREVEGQKPKVISRHPAAKPKREAAKDTGPSTLHTIQSWPTSRRSSKRGHQSSVESVEQVKRGAPPSLPQHSAPVRTSTRLVKKKARVQPPTPPLLDAFPHDPHVSGGLALGFEDLLEPTVEQRPQRNGTPMEKDTSSHGPRQVMTLKVPTAVYDQESGDVNFEEQIWHFPYRAQRDYVGQPLPEEDQVNCKPIRQMVKLWEDSKAASGMGGHFVQGITKSTFLNLSDQERGMILQDFLVIKDMDVPLEFIPRPLREATPAHPEVTDASGAILVTDDAPSAHLALVAVSPPFPPYRDSMEVSFASLSTLAPGRMLDTAVLDFSFRYLHKRLHLRQPSVARRVVIFTSMVWKSFVTWSRSQSLHAPTGNTACRAQLRTLLCNASFAGADQWVFALHDDSHFAMAVIHMPWASLSNIDGAFTTILYFDSMKRATALASGEQFAMIILELDAARQGKDINEPIDVVQLNHIASSVVFQVVEVPQQAIGTVTCGLNSVHNLEVLFSMLRPNITSILDGRSQEVYKSMPDFDKLRRNIVDWLLSNFAQPLSFTRHDQEHWSHLPESLHWIHARYMDNYIEKHLGVDPDVSVSVRDFSAVTFSGDPEYRHMTIRDIGLELLKREDAKVLNALSIGSSGVHNQQDLHIAISDDNRALVSCSSAGITKTLTTGLSTGLNTWHIMSSPGTFHTSHFDASGLTTIITVREGLKGWLWGRRRNPDAPIPTPGDGDGDPDSWHWSLFDNCEVNFVVLGPGDSAIMPPGTPHAVISLERPGCQPVCTVMSGSHCYSRFTMRASLLGAIRHMLWHDVWTNALHDDRDYLIARMLTWQRIKQEAHAELPFQGKEFYALLVMGLLPHILCSVPYWRVGGKNLGKHWLERYDPLSEHDLEDNPSNALLTSVREYMVRISRSFISNLSPSASTEFVQFWTDIRNIFISEYERRCNFNIDIVE